MKHRKWVRIWIEIFSPGIFPGPLDTHNLKLSLTFIRNKIICKVFREACLIEKLGSGFITLFESYEKQGLHKPEVIEGEGFLKCILPRPSFGGGDVSNDDVKKLFSGNCWLAREREGWIKRDYA